MKKLWLSFHYATEGLIQALKSERNLRIHIFSAVIVVIFGFLCKISSVEWCILLLTIGGMIVLELINTAIERTVDLATDKIHPLAKQAKDIAAAACFIFAIISVIIGLLIFLPKIT
ncbi:diacylglycerol kinase family protein [Caldibacillus lycopersici]|uniref:Diacylglycerol kinase family protein n=1 Tax=Perspicuibacillus lycopersici TaxID=1325689 RepID=A0AAE3LMT1_9BACI|nr:diacylglycerol kinase family protein [Perspicuibacillus lycopersici]MCU9613915.1 diacylglycerol kinase family protein [Perspicuibacillus lycopersici]